MSIQLFRARPWCFNVPAILFGVLLSILISCETFRNDKVENYTFSGKVQKGPFVVGSTITLYEVNDRLQQTGKVFNADIQSHDGQFELKSIDLASNLVLLNADGYYFNENMGKMSAGRLSIQAYADLTEKETVNINTLTHVITGRIEKLLEEGSSFTDAKLQAEREFFHTLGITDSLNVQFEELDISEISNGNAALLAFSVITQKTAYYMSEIPTLTAQLTQLLTEIKYDFKEDGILNDEYVIDKLQKNISQLNYLQLRGNIEKRYAEIGVDVSIPDFEQYVARIQAKFSDELYTEFYYPDMATPEPIHAPDSRIPNILALYDTVFQANPYCIAAIVPFDSSLKIRFITNGNCGFGGGLYGWSATQQSDGFTLTSQRQNALMTMLFHLDLTGSAVIEYYENDSELPTYSKKIRWE